MFGENKGEEAPGPRLEGARVAGIYLLSAVILVRLSYWGDDDESPPAQVAPSCESGAPRPEVPGSLGDVPRTLGSGTGRRGLWEGGMVPDMAYQCGYVYFGRHTKQRRGLVGVPGCLTHHTGKALPRGMSITIASISMFPRGLIK